MAMGILGRSSGPRPFGLKRTYRNGPPARCFAPTNRTQPSDEESIMRTTPILLLASLSVACMGPESAEELPITRLAKGQHSMQTEQQFEVISGQSQFQYLWNLFDAGPAPSLDFTQESAIAVFMGERPTGGYSIRVASVTHRDDELLVEVVLQAPGP